MTFPTFPATLTWNTPYRDRERVNSARYQSGVEQVERIGINRRSQSIDVTIRIQNAAEIEAFLRERRGRPFRLPVESRLLGEDLLYSCDEWEMPELGKELWEFRGTFNQERRFEPKIAQYLSLTADRVNAVAGESIQLTAGLSGFSSMPTLSWSIVNGPGAIVAGANGTAVYSTSLGSTGGAVTIRVRVLGTDLEARTTLTIARNPGVVSVQITPSSIDRDAALTNPVSLLASVTTNGGAANAVLWSIRSGTALLDNSASTTTEILLPGLEQSVTVRATSIADSSKWAESQIRVRRMAIITEIQASAAQTSLIPQGSTALSALVIGTGNFDPSFTWSIVSGDGTLNGTQYTAGTQTGSVILEVVSVGNPLIKRRLTLSIVPMNTWTITGINVSANPSSVLVNESTTLSAQVIGTGTFDPNVTWSIVSGGGILNGSQYTAGQSAGTAILEATSVGNPTIKQQLSIVVSTNITWTITGIDVSGNPDEIIFGQAIQLVAIVLGTGSFDPNVTWSIVSGDGTLNGSEYTAGQSVETVFLLATSVGNPAITQTKLIDVSAPGPITGITVSASPVSVTIGQSTSLSAVLSGTGTFNPNVTWSIYLGNGILNGNQYLSGPIVGSAILLATSIQNSAVFAFLWIEQVEVSIVEVSGSSSFMFVGESIQLAVTVAGSYNLTNFDVIWSIDSGPGVITGTIFTSMTPGTTIVRATSVQDQTKFGLFTIETF